MNSFAKMTWDILAEDISKDSYQSSIKILCPLVGICSSLWFWNIIILVWFISHSKWHLIKYYLPYLKSPLLWKLYSSYKSLKLYILHLPLLLQNTSLIFVVYQTKNTIQLVTGHNLREKSFSHQLTIVCCCQQNGKR